VSLAGSRNFSVQSKMGIEVLDYMKNFEATYVTDDRLRYVFGGDPAADQTTTPAMPIGPLGSPTEGGGDLGVHPANSFSRSLSEARRWIFNTIRAADGAQQFGQRKYGIRFFNNYRFPSGPLRGFGIGGGVRWESPNVADPATRELLFGRDRTLVDLTLSYRRKLTDRLDWSIQLNIKNLLDNDDFIITKMHREFQGRFLEQPEIKQYFFENPRRILLTNTISF
jgi:outer membrane receptor protein involved in Fe transport